MTVRSWWKRLCKGKWDQNRLTSRKFLTTIGFYVGIMAVAVVLATVFHLNSNSIVETAINATERVVIAWLAVQGVRDIRKAWKDTVGNGDPGGTV